VWASAGNREPSKTSLLMIVIGMIGIVLFVIVPFLKEFEIKPTENGVIVSTTKDSSSE
jgi:hypothetical protein